MTDARGEAIAAVIDAIVGVAAQLSGDSSAPLGDGTLTPAQLTLLFEVSRVDSATVSELASRLHVSLGAVSQLVGPLERDGWVSRVADAADGRQRNIALTSEARTRVDAMQRERIAAITPRFDALSTSELDAVARALGRVTLTNSEDDTPRGGR